MVRMLNETPIDMVIFGNHEDDIKHEFVVQRAAEYNGVWINTNMQTHDAFKAGHMVASHIIELGSPARRRRVGFIGVLTDDPAMYRSNAFGGARIECPYATMRAYKAKLEAEDGVDLVVPLCHLYVPQDHRTCEELDFPLVLSGHDHHCVDEVHCGTRLLKVTHARTHARTRTHTCGTRIVKVCRLPTHLAEARTHARTHARSRAHTQDSFACIR